MNLVFEIVQAPPMEFSFPKYSAYEDRAVQQIDIDPHRSPADFKRPLVCRLHEPRTATDEEIIKNYSENSPWRNIHDPALGNFGPIAQAWNIRGWPTVYLLDAEGKIRHKHLRGSIMDQAITTLLNELGIKVEITHHENLK